MKIECPIDPNILIGEIGDPCFSICDDEWNEFYRHSDHPKTLRIIDCENNQTIDVTGEDPDERTNSGVNEELMGKADD